MVDVCSKTVRRALWAAGISRVKPPRQAASDAQGPAGQAKRYGCTSAHRHPVTHGQYNTCLTDTECARVADLFERLAGARGMTARLARRTLVDACRYVLLLATAAQLVSRLAHRVQLVQSLGAQGVIEVMHDRLHAQWRERL